MKKKILSSITALAFVLTVVASAAPAGAEPADDSLPQTPGTYSVPGHSHLKLRVFVHNAKNQSGPSVNPVLSLQCNLSDPDSSTADGIIGWHLPSGNWTYHLNTGSAPSTIGGTNLSTLTGNAFGKWATTDVGKSVSFVKGSNTSANRARYDGQNIVSWGRTSGSALAVTYTWYNQSTGVVAENDTIFNSKFAWAWSSQSNCAYSGYYDAQDILTHELGHWMGLDDNYDASYTNNTMYGYGSPTEVKKNTLASGDVSAVNSIY